MLDPTERREEPLFADSQLLFWKRGDALFLESIRALLTTESPKAAYVGASNGDVLDYFGIFEAAVTSVGITDYRMIKSSYSTEDASFLEQADLILLAGRDRMADVDRHGDVDESNFRTAASVRAHR